MIKGPIQQAQSMGSARQAEDLHMEIMLLGQGNMI